MTPLAAAFLAVLQVGHPGELPLAERAATELSALRPGVTPSAWLATHPDDLFLLFRRELIRENHGNWCARASSTEQQSGGTRMVRYAYFYPPPPAPQLALPTTSGATLIREQCLLGLVWIEAAAGDSVSGSAAAEGIRAALSRRYGPVKAGPDVFFGRVPTDSQRRFMSRLPGAEAMLLGLHYFGAAGWRVPGRWQVDSTVIVSAFDHGLASHEGPGRLLAFAQLPIAKLGSFRQEADRSEVAERRTAALAMEAARLSGLDSARTHELVALIAAADSAYHEQGSRSPKRLDADAVEVIRHWTTAGRALAPPPRRAAALLTADQVLGSQPMTYVRAQRQDTARIAYEKLGAEFARDELGGGYNYTHNWLDEALRLDPHGPVGRLATLALLRSGFNEAGMCGGGSEAFRKVITTGEQLLAGDLDSSTGAEVHRLVGDAYADIVALAAGAGSEYADSAAFLADAPAARDSALAHYRKALALERVSPEARWSWLEAWRLLAGLPPSTTHFFCVYD